MALTRLNNNAYGETISVAKGGTGVTTSADLANTGNMVLLNSSTLSSVTSIEYDNTIITDTYDIYELHLTKLNGTSDYNISFRVSEDNGSNYITSAVYKRCWLGGNHGNTNDAANSRFAAFDRGYLAGNINSIGATDKETAALKVTFHNLRDSSVGKIAFGQYHGETDAEKGAMEVGGIYLDDDAVVNNLKILFSAGTVSGKATLYGVKT